MAAGDSSSRRAAAAGTKYRAGAAAGKKIPFFAASIDIGGGRGETGINIGTFIGGALQHVVKQLPLPVRPCCCGMAKSAGASYPGSKQRKWRKLQPRRPMLPLRLLLPIKAGSTSLARAAATMAPGGVFPSAMNRLPHDRGLAGYYVQYKGA